MINDVYLISCDDYELNNAYNKLKFLLEDNDLLDFVKNDMVIAIKTNLVSTSKPESAVITHPHLLYALCKILIEKGAKVIVGDSPGGLYQEAVLSSMYHKTGLETILETGALLNHDFQQQVVETNSLKLIKHLDCCSWLLKADAIINFCKLKTHGMMSLSASCKNMFGAVPGTLKLEYHYRYPSHNDFADMLIDIQEFYKCKLHICDAIMAMEGNGPTKGTPRKVGLLLASKSCYALDLVCCKIIGLDINQVPTIKQAIERNLCVDNVDKVSINMNIDNYLISDFKNIEHLDNIQFYSEDGKSWFKKIVGKLAKSILLVRPRVKNKECIGCKKCANICPANAIVMKNKKPIIDKKKCIRCFCCQEFCPVGAMKTHRTIMSKILTKKKSTNK